MSNREFQSPTAFRQDNASSTVRLDDPWVKSGASRLPGITGRGYQGDTARAEPRWTASETVYQAAQRNTSRPRPKVLVRGPARLRQRGDVSRDCCSKVKAGQPDWRITFRRVPAMGAPSRVTRRCANHGARAGRWRVPKPGWTASAPVLPAVADADLGDRVPVK